MKFSYCTLFDSNYIDKGAVTIDSFLEHNTSSKMYVLCMDEKCHEILNEEYKEIDRITFVTLSEFLNKCERLKKVREDRSPGEFSWSCASSLLQYVFDVYGEECVTYIDADLSFYNDPDILVNEMLEKEKEVLIVEHRFKENFAGRQMQKFAGRFCVEFNTFLNTEKSREVLDKWVDDVISSCASDPESGKPLGDQGYLDEWPEKYDCICICDNPGAGIAPWNIDRYTKDDLNSDKIIFDKKKEIDPIFYHFQGLKYESDSIVNINIHNYISRLFVDDKIVAYFYDQYLLNIDNKKKYIKERYGLYSVIKSHPAYSKEKPAKRKRTGKISIGKIYEKIRIRINRFLKEKICVDKDRIDLNKLRNQ